MTTRILATLTLIALASAANAQDPYAAMYGRMMQYEAQKQAMIAQYVDKHGYENLYAEYAQTCQQVAQYGYDCSALPFEHHIWLKMQEEAGIDTQKNFEIGIKMHGDLMDMQDQNFRAHQRRVSELQEVYDRSNRGWEINQGIRDQVFANGSAVQRGVWDYSSGDSDVAITLPHAPNQNEVYTDGTHYYIHDGFDWLRFDNEELEGPSVIMQPLPNVVN